MATKPAVLLSITPMIATGGILADALAFYTQQMGFTVVWQGDGMAGISRGSVAFNLIVNNNREWIENSSFSIGVSDLDALHQEFRGLNVNVGPLEVKAWGRREFHMIVPSGVSSGLHEGVSDRDFGSAHHE